MGERGGGADAGAGGGQGFGNVAENHVVVVGDTVWMGCDAPVKDENFTVGEQFPQVIEGAAVAEAQFQNRARRIGLRPPITSWGVLLAEAQNINVVALYPWLMLPVMPVIIVILAFNFLGDGLRDAADPYK